MRAASGPKDGRRRLNEPVAPAAIVMTELTASSSIAPSGASLRGGRKEWQPLLAATALLLSFLCCCAAGNELPAGDRIVVVNARACGLRCESEAMFTKLRGELHVQQAGAAVHWERLDCRELLKEFSTPLPTVVYVHGNRIENGEDKSQGLQIYRALFSSEQRSVPRRFVVWSWPSEQIPGPLRDYKIKAARTEPAAWQLAWLLDRMPASSPTAVIGYSYGARVATGALHLLGGGSIGRLELTNRIHPQTPPIQLALLAAAMRADWLRPGGRHGRALTQTSELLLINNRYDPVMRFFHLTSEGLGVNALGYSGPTGITGASELGRRFRNVDVTNAVGRHHALAEYLSTGGVVVGPLRRIAEPQLAAVTAAASEPLFAPPPAL